jgi:hypothetical protein
MQTSINAARDAMYVSAQFLSMPHSLTIYRLLRNQQQSSLLRLPAELRNRIYELVVGGQEIRMVASKRDHDPQPFAIKLRSVTSQDINTTDGDVEMSDDTTTTTTTTTNAVGFPVQDDFRELMIEEPIPPRWTKPHHFLALTAVSRQFHMETALLPFSLNEFSGRYIYRFTSFLCSLQPHQRNAIAKVRILIQDTYITIHKLHKLPSNPFSPVLLAQHIPNSTIRTLLRSLGGLECVVVEKWRNITRVKCQDSEVAVEKVEAMLQGKCVKVCVEMVAWGDA